MRLHRITLENFKGVHKRTIEFPDRGVTILVGRNESGKSSVLEALDLLLDTLPSSKGKEAKAARPEGRDVGVFVEAELTLSEQRVRYRKWWWKNVGAELKFLDGPRAGHSATGREAHEAVVELLERGDRTLWQALRLLQTGTRSDDFAGSSSLRRALEAGGGNDHDDSDGLTVLEAARAERARYFTDHGREKGETASLRRRYDDVVQRHDNAVQAMEQIVTAVEAYDVAAQDAAAAKSTAEAAAQDLAEAEESAARIEALGRQRTAAAQAVELARTRSLRSEQDWQQRTQLIARVDTAAQERTALEQSVADLSATAHERDAVTAQAREALGKARESERVARSTYQDARAREQAARDASQLAELAVVLEQLDSLTRESARWAQTETSGITQADVDALERAHRDVELAQSQLTAGSAHLTVTALATDVPVQIDGQATALVAQQSRHQAVTEPVTVELPGRLRVVVDPEEGLRSRQDKVQAAQDALTAVQSRVGVDSLAQARQALDADRQRAAQLASVEQRKALVLQGRQESQVREDAQRLATTLDPSAPDSPQHQADPHDLRDVARKAAASLETARDTAIRCDQAYQEADRRSRTAQLDLTQARAQLEAARHVHAGLVEQLESARAVSTDDALEQQQAEASTAWAEAEATSERLQTQWTTSNAEQILTQLRGHRIRVDRARRTLESAQAARSRAEGTLDGLDRDARQREFDHALTQRRAVAQELATHLRRAAAARLLAETLEHFQAEAHRRYNAPFRQQLELLGRTVFGSTFEVELADDLTITRRRLNGTWLEVSALSTGAKEQLDVLIRLAVATLVDPEDGVPVVLDDALGHSDPNRLISLAAALSEAGKNAQVILLTATPDRFSALEPASTVAIDAQR